MPFFASTSSPTYNLSALPSVNSLEEGVKEYHIVRYISIAACAWLFFDHVLTITEEVELVWKAPRSIAKYGFQFIRYTTPTTMALMADIISGSASELTDSFCQHFIPALAVLTLIFGIIADVIAILHVSTLWKRNVKVFAVLTISFVVTTAAAAITRFLGLSHLTPTVTHNTFLNICSGTEKPLLLAAPWGAGLIFDLIVIAFICWNAVRRPPNEKTPLVQALYRDSLGYFVIVSVIRTFNLVLTIAAPLWIFSLVATVSWPSFSVNLSRFIFRLRSRQQARADEEEKGLREEEGGGLPDELREHIQLNPRAYQRV